MPVNTSPEFIVGFVSGQARIDVAAVDAIASTAANEASVLVLATAFDAPGQVRFAAGELFNVDAHLDADLVVRLSFGSPTRRPT